MEATPYFSGLKINGYLMKEWTERRNEYKTVIGEERKRYSLPDFFFFADTISYFALQIVLHSLFL